MHLDSRAVLPQNLYSQLQEGLDWGRHKWQLLLYWCSKQGKEKGNGKGGSVVASTAKATVDYGSSSGHRSNGHWWFVVEEEEEGESEGICLSCILVAFENVCLAFISIS